MWKWQEGRRLEDEGQRYLGVRLLHTYIYTRGNLLIKTNTLGLMKMWGIAPPAFTFFGFPVVVFILLLRLRAWLLLHHLFIFLFFLHWESKKTKQRALMLINSCSNFPRPPAMCPPPPLLTKIIIPRLAPVHLTHIRSKWVSFTNTQFFKQNQNIIHTRCRICCTVAHVYEAQRLKNNIYIRKLSRVHFRLVAVQHVSTWSACVEINPHHAHK